MPNVQVDLHERADLLHTLSVQILVVSCRFELERCCFRKLQKLNRLLILYIQRAVLLVLELLVQSSLKFKRSAVEL